MNRNSSISGEFAEFADPKNQLPEGSSSDSENTQNQEPEAVANQVIVKFNPGIRSADISTLQASLGASVLETTNTSGVQLWSIRGDADAAIAAHRNNPAIEYIEPNYIVQTTAIPDDPDFDQHWGLNNTGQTGGTPDADIDAAEAWDITTGSSDVVVGVIDTGVDYTHPDLVDNIWTNPGEIAGDGIDNDGNGYVDDVHGYDFINNDGDPFDDNGHGTHVSGTIAARGNNGTGATGVNWSAQIMGLKFLDAGGSGTTFAAIQAIEYATMMKTQYGVNINLTNNSWGGGGFSQALSDAIEAAGDADQLFIAAAGNGGFDGIGDDNDLTPHYPSNYDLDNIISVAATDDNDNKSGFSNFGETSTDLGAPGSNIWSTLPNGNYGFLSGTSMATPHVAGVAALLWSQDADFTALEVKEQILSSVDPIAALDGITVTGGRLNALQALVSTVAGSIEGSKWHDLDGDGILDGNEPTLSGWTIYIDDNNNGELDSGERSTVTDADGNYRFSFVTPGTYTVGEVLQSGWTQTYPNAPGTHTVEVGESEDVTDIDFGNLLTNPAEITGVKWNDLDKDGVRDAAEPGLEGWTIYIDANNNGEFDPGELSTVTDTNGEYTFDNLPAGSYIVAEVQQPGWGQTSPFLGSIELFNADFSDSNGNPSLDGFTIDNTGATVPGLWHLSTGRGNQPGHSAEDSVYFGTGEGPNDRGNYDVGDTAGRITSPTIDLTGVTNPELSFNYVLASEGGNPWDSARVLISENGGAFEAIASNADLLDDPTTGWTNATLNLSDYAGSSIEIQFDFDTIDSLANTFEGWYVDDVVVSEVGEGTHILELAPDEVATDINFGNAELDPGAIQGIKWNDIDGNGIQDADELGLEGWTIFLDDNENGELDTGEQFTVTDVNGEYSFANLTPGTYTVAEVQQDGWQQTYPSLRGSVLDESNDTILTAIASGLTSSIPASFSDAGSIGDNSNVSPSADVDLIELQLNAGDIVTIDIDAAEFGSSLDSVLRLFDSSGSQVAMSDDFPAPGESFSLDSYLEFTAAVSDTYYVGISSYNNFSYDPFEEGSSSGLSDGDYQIEIALNGGGSDSSGFGTHTVTVNPGEIVTDIDFGNQSLLGEIAGSKWHDLDGDGIRDDGEPGLANWTIYIDDNDNGELDADETFTTTDELGNYSFSVDAGTYTIAEVIEPGWEQTHPSTGSHEVSLDPSETVNGIDFGNITLPGELSGSKWNDIDGDGVRDVGESGLEGWTIYLDDNGNGVLDGEEVSTVTDADGNYSFTDLDAGSYVVAEVLQPGWEQTHPSDGFYTVNLDPGDAIADLDFGNRFVANLIEGTPNAESIDGTAGFDLIRGFAGNDRLRGLENRDFLFGDEGRDTLQGGVGDDTLIGGTGDDIVNGSSGMDVLVGVDPESAQPGLGEVDRFRGGSGADIFVLGDASTVYYDNGNDATSGGDRATIFNFAVGEDTIQLHGTSDDYELQSASNGTNIFLKTDNVSERIGLVRNIDVSELDLESSSFVFV